MNTPLIPIIIILNIITSCILIFRLVLKPTTLVFKVFWSLVLCVPFLGVFLYLGFSSPPKPAPMHLRATMNHFGRGGKFTGNDSKRYNYDPLINECDDENNKK